MIVLSWIAAVYVLVSFSLVRKFGLRQFDWANAISFIFVITPIIQAGVYSGAIIPTAFGIISIVRLIRNE